MHEIESYITTRKGILHFIIFFAWVVTFGSLFLFGDTFHRWWLPFLFVFLTGVSFAPDWKEFLNWNKKSSQSAFLLFVVWTFSLTWWSISVLSSHFIPFSLDVWKIQAALYLVFWIVFFRTKLLRSVQLTQVISGVSVFIGVLLALLSFVFFANPVLAAKLPGFNILYASYGHNHLASYLLLILPLSWWWILKVKSNVYVLIPLFLTFSLLTSFGRVAVFTGLIQLIVMSAFLNGVFNKRLTINLQAKQLLPKKLLKIISFIMLILVSFFLTAIFLKIILSSLYSFFPSYSCPFPQYRMQLCKPISNESRPEYWSQAVNAFKDFPLFGYGLGTFSLISNRYATQAWNITGYAHNAYLHFFAETGFIGGFAFIALNGSILLALYTKIKHKIIELSKLKKQVTKQISQQNLKNAIEQVTVDLLFIIAISFGFVSLVLNNIFDFDWSFFSVSVSALLLVALVLSLPEAAEKRIISLKSNTKILLLISLFSKVYSLIIFLLVLLLFLLVSVTEWMYFHKKYSDVVRFFPYVSHYSVEFSNYTNWSQEELTKLVEMNKHNPYFLSDILRIHQDSTSWLRWYSYLQIVDPSHQFTQPLVHTWLQKNGTLSQKISFYDSFMMEIDAHSQIAERNFLAKKRVKQTYIQMANTIYLQGDTELALQTYIQAQKIDEWALSNHELVFLTNQAPVPDTAFLHELAEKSGRRLGNNTNQFVEIYLKNLEKKEIGIDTDTLLKGYTSILTIHPWRATEVWELISSAIVSNQEASITYSSDFEGGDTAFEITEFWYALWNVTDTALKKHTKEYDLNYEYKTKLVQSLQRNALHYLNQGETQKAILNTQYMQNVLTEDYAALAQLGHLYSTLRKKDLAQAAYGLCISQYKIAYQGEIHAECKNGLSMLKKGFFWIERYDQTAAIILGEATWTDF